MSPPFVAAAGVSKSWWKEWRLVISLDDFGRTFGVEPNQGLICCHCEDALVVKLGLANRDKALVLGPFDGHDICGKPDLIAGGSVVRHVSALLILHEGHPKAVPPFDDAGSAERYAIQIAYGEKTQKK